MSFGIDCESCSIVFFAADMTSRAFEPAACESEIIAAGAPLTLAWVLYVSEPSSMRAMSRSLTRPPCSVVRTMILSNSLMLERRPRVCSE